MHVTINNNMCPPPQRLSSKAWRIHCHIHVLYTGYMQIWIQGLVLLMTCIRICKHVKYLIFLLFLRENSCKYTIFTTNIIRRLGSWISKQCGCIFLQRDAIFLADFHFFLFHFLHIFFSWGGGLTLRIFLTSEWLLDLPDLEIFLSILNFFNGKK